MDTYTQESSHAKPVEGTSLNNSINWEGEAYYVTMGVLEKSLQNIRQKVL
jgi:hypothetical protein